MKKQTNLPVVSKKLTLNKKTISNLTVAEMNSKVGGDKTKGHKYTCDWTCGCYTYGRTCTVWLLCC